MKKHAFLLLLTFLFIKYADCQKVSSKENTWLVGVNTSVDYCYRTLLDKSGVSKWQETIAKMNTDEHGAAGYSIGLNTSKVLRNNSFRFNIGINYTFHAYRGSSDFDFLMLDSTRKYTSELVKTQFGYLKVPIKVDIFVYRNPKWKLFIPIGFCPSFLIDASVDETYHYPDGSQSNTLTKLGALNYNITNASLSAGLGVDFSLSKYFLVWLQPHFEYYLLNITKNSNYKAYLYSMGFTFGISYKLNSKALFYNM